MLPFTPRLFHKLFQSSPFCHSLHRLRQFSIKPSQPSGPSLTSHRISSANALSALQGPRLQSEVLHLIEDELRDATYYVDLTSEGGLLHADPIIVEAITDSLKATFHALISKGISSPTVPRFPIKGFDREFKAYGPLIDLLNIIVDSANRSIPRGQLHGLKFHHFENEVKDRHGGHRGLKPDGVGIIGDMRTKPAKGRDISSPEVYWEGVEVFIECKISTGIREMVKQSGTYARRCLLSNRRRFFSLGIGFLHDKLEAYVFVFHRSGLSSSRPLKLTTKEGFNGLVRHIVGILSFKEEADYGLNNTRYQDTFRINGRHFKILDRLYAHDSLRGRATNVYRLQGVYTYGF